MPPGFLLGGFRCEAPDNADAIGAYLADGTAARDQEVGFSRPYLVRDGAGEVIGYYTLLADAIRLEDGEVDSTWDYRSAPCIKVARLGVRYDRRGSGIGPALLELITVQALELGQQIGVCYLTLDAVGDKVDWYRKRGFEFTRIADQPSTEADKANGDRSMRYDLGPLQDRPLL
ncbi:MAG: GNAT family N-acetyltransferase [Gemmatimonadetes bacterium]|nr:GNAT family N-acetyltransferase [Gemmatimonadota bacterium]